MFGFSGEHLLVLLVILLIFGPKRLPDLGHSIGRTLKNFKDALNSNGETPAASRGIPPSAQIPPHTAAPAATGPAPETASSQSAMGEKQAEKV